ncbi:Transcriptional regulator ure2 [Savitreella phatthalungensis]
MPEIHLLTAGTPNGHKISILLEELGLKYRTTAISFEKKDQKTASFLAINPNGRIPAIEDVGAGADGSNVPVFESGAIMLYLCGKYDPDHKVSFPHDSPEYWEVVQWLFFMNAGLGPMQGQANHFHRYAPEKIPYAIDRYQSETRRLYSVLDGRLGVQSSGWLVGDRYSIADMANFCWVNMGFWAGVDPTPEEFPHLCKWVERIEERQATKKGLDVPTPFTLKQKYRDNPQSVEDHAKQASKWILQGQKDDQDKIKSKA